MEVLWVAGAISSIVCACALVWTVGTRTGRLVVSRYLSTHAPSCGLIAQEGVPIQVGFCGRCGEDFLWLGFITYTDNYWSDRLPWLRWFSWLNRDVVRKMLTYSRTFHRCPETYLDAA